MKMIKHRLGCLNWEVEEVDLASIGSTWATDSVSLNRKPKCDEKLYKWFHIKGSKLTCFSRSNRWTTMHGLPSFSIIFPWEFPWFAVELLQCYHTIHVIRLRSLTTRESRVLWCRARGSHGGRHETTIDHDIKRSNGPSLVVEFWAISDWRTSWNIMVEPF